MPLVVLKVLNLHLTLADNKSLSRLPQGIDSGKPQWDNYIRLPGWG